MVNTSNTIPMYQRSHMTPILFAFFARNPLHRLSEVITNVVPRRARTAGNPEVPPGSCVKAVFDRTTETHQGTPLN